MKLNKNILIIYYLILYITLLIGFFLGEDFARGFEYDYRIHQNLIKDLFDVSVVYGLLNYDENYVPHSPLFIIYIVIFKQIFVFEDIFRFINLHICLLIPIFSGLCLKYRFNLKKNDPIYILPSIFFFSPYFRAGAIWTDDNILALIFFTIALFYFVKYEKNKSETKYIILNTFFLAMSCYLRPIYCIFSVYFFTIYFINLRFQKKFIIYVLLNLLLAFPAFYYVFILGIDKWVFTYLFRENIITPISLASTIMCFYLFPFLMKDILKKWSELFYFKNLFILGIVFILLLFYFSYERNYSGGIFYRLSYIIFDNSILFFIISSLSLLILSFVFGKKISFKNIDILIIIILFLLEIDGVVYHETYDPLIYILILCLFKNKIINKFISSLNFNKLILLFGYLILFYISSVFRTLVL
tara:strand:- start:15559 stop:16800 length:1242 start_codon:yes stop_codon:yes gene_type:complete